VSVYETPIPTNAPLHQGVDFSDPLPDPQIDQENGQKDVSFVQGVPKQ